MIINVCFLTLYLIWFKIEFSVAAATFFRITWFCSDFIIIMHDSSVKRSYTFSEVLNNTCMNLYITSAARVDRKYYVIINK